MISIINKTKINKCLNFSFHSFSSVYAIARSEICNRFMQFKRVLEKRKIPHASSRGSVQQPQSTTGNVERAQQV